MAPGLPDLKDETAVRNYLVARKALDEASRRYPWYDSGWLRSYTAAKALIGHLRPDILSGFIATFEPLRTPAEFTVRYLDRVFDEHCLETIRETIRSLPREALEPHETERFGRAVVHNHPLFCELQTLVARMVSEQVGEAVEASYNFLSLYSEFGVCEPHMDSPLAKWTLDICIDQTRPWPIHISQVIDWPESFPADDMDWGARIRNDLELRFSAHSLEPGRAVIFSGSSQWHYRDPLPKATEGDFCNLLFFHFLPAGMRDVVRPASWPEMFGMPELAWVAVDAD